LEQIISSGAKLFSLGQQISRFYKTQNSWQCSQEPFTGPHIWPEKFFMHSFTAFYFITLIQFVDGSKLKIKFCLQLRISEVS
jgi:uncharacterized membrane protein